MCMSAVYMYACVPHVYLVPKAIGVRSHGTGVTDNCELPCGDQTWVLGLLQEKQALLTTE